MWKLNVFPQGMSKDTEKYPAYGESMVNLVENFSDQEAIETLKENKIENVVLNFATNVDEKRKKEVLDLFSKNFIQTQVN